MISRAAALVCLLALAAEVPLARGAVQDAPPPQKPETELRTPVDVPETMTPEQARVVLERYLAFIVRTQHSDGSWGSGSPEALMELGFSVETYYCWQVGSHALACLALMEAKETPESRAVLERALHWLCKTRVPARGDDWDVDYMWPALYGLVATTHAAQDPRFASKEWKSELEARGLDFFGILERNQVPEGGWGYYDDPPFTQRPKWATSFATATVLPAVADAAKLGWNKDPAILARAIDYVHRCALPNGAYEYDLNPIPRLKGGEHINNVKGSLGRIQVCNWALAKSGVKSITPDRVREGLAAFFEHHRFLDVARMRPVPHEAYYANAGYFYFFGHYYAAEAINLLPMEEREHWHAKLRPHVAKTQYDDGSTGDFLTSSYDILGATAFAALALELGLPGYGAPKQ